MTPMILGALAQVEMGHGVKIHGAWESGSRCWGLESTDSDWDVRFIYSRPRIDYLCLTPKRDVIEVLIEEHALDISGWDIKKAMLLAGSSNPSMLEWLASPITYHENILISRLRRVMVDFDPRALMHHYVSLATRQYKQYWQPLEGDHAPIRLKKYLYAIRPLLCVIWMHQHNHAMPPMEFTELRHGVLTGPAINNEIDALLRLKRAGTEMGEGRFPALDRFIMHGMTTFHDMAEEAPSRKPDFAELQDIFWTAIGAKNG